MIFLCLSISLFRSLSLSLFLSPFSVLPLPPFISSSPLNLPKFVCPFVRRRLSVRPFERVRTFPLLDSFLIGCGSDVWADANSNRANEEPSTWELEDEEGAKG